MHSKFKRYNFILPLILLKTQGSLVNYPYQPKKQQGVQEKLSYMRFLIPLDLVISFVHTALSWPLLVWGSDLPNLAPLYILCLKRESLSTGNTLTILTLIIFYQMDNNLSIFLIVIVRCLGHWKEMQLRGLLRTHRDRNWEIWELVGNRLERSKSWDGLGKLLGCVFLPCVI